MAMLLLHIAPKVLPEHLFSSLSYPYDHYSPSVTFHPSPTVEQEGGNTVLRFDARKGTDALTIARMVASWGDFAAKYRAGSISKDEYDRWRYNYPAFDESQHYAKMPSEELSDALVNAVLKNRK
ncbi:MAG: hypothetical protein J5493_04660 [Lachnospiraceae bacterium]|nr:hypothetical protein [Lachnospiraceae bacterium]